ncbi:MAG: hypothetical protein ACI9V8_001774 [Urechidicola sp.]
MQLSVNSGQLRWKASTTTDDYFSNGQTSQLFFATVQNKRDYAVHGYTAAELIGERTDGHKANMGLSSWMDGRVSKNTLELRRIICPVRNW